MDKKGWKATAIAFIILFLLLLAFNIYATNKVIQEEEKMNECFYDVCEEYVDAWYEEKICYCYEYGLLGDLQIAKTKYMK